MESNETKNEKNYDISFFKPTTKIARFNRNLILGLLIIWAVAIFGFQILLRIVEEQRPEKAFIEYESVWNNISSDNASIAQKQIFIKSALSVLGKVTIAPKDRSVLNSAVNKLTIELVPEAEKPAFISKIEAFKAVEYGDNNYQELKLELGAAAGNYIGEEAYTLESKLIPLELAAAESATINTNEVEAVMAKYLIHNQSFITDYVFLGFPFHYFYTAVFLLILFVGLCLYYCIATERSMKKLGIIEG